MKAGTLILPVSAGCAIKIRRKRIDNAFYRFKMTMLGILGQVKPFVLFKKCLIDNATFRLHYKVYWRGCFFLFLTILVFFLFSICFSPVFEFSFCPQFSFVLLCLASLLTTLKENFGAPIDCIVDKDVPESVFEVLLLE